MAPPMFRPASPRETPQEHPTRSKIPRNHKQTLDIIIYVQRGGVVVNKGVFVGSVTFLVYFLGVAAWCCCRNHMRNQALAGLTTTIHV